jgi:hypothetical protein
MADARWLQNPLMRGLLEDEDSPLRKKPTYKQEQVHKAAKEAGKSSEAYGSVLPTFMAPDMKAMRAKSAEIRDGHSVRRRVSGEHRGTVPGAPWRGDVRTAPGYPQFMQSFEEKPKTANPSGGGGRSKWDGLLDAIRQRGRMAEGSPYRDPDANILRGVESSDVWFNEAGAIPSAEAIQRKMGVLPALQNTGGATEARYPSASVLAEQTHAREKVQADERIGHRQADAVDAANEISAHLAPHEAKLMDWQSADFEELVEHSKEKRMQEREQGRPRNRSAPAVLMELIESGEIDEILAEVMGGRRGEWK